MSNDGLDKRIRKRAAVPARRLPALLAEDAAAGKLLRHADELRQQLTQQADEEQRTQAQIRLRAQDRPVVSAAEWISNPYYTGGLAIWPKIRDLFIEIVEGRYNLIVLRGAAGWGKTMLARALTLRSLYEIGCYGSPQTSIGQFAPGFPLRVSLVHVDRDKAEEKLFLPLAAAIRRANWFSENLRGQNRLYNNTGVNSLTLTRPGLQDPFLTIGPVPTNPDEVIGDDLVVCHMSECNKYDFVEDSKRARSNQQAGVYDVAMEIYRELQVRLTTRFFRPHEPCVRLIFDSSERYEGDFLARVTPMLPDSGIRHIVISKTNWDTRPGEDVPPYFLFAKPRKGASAEVVESEERKAYLLEHGRELVLVPEGAERQNLLMASKSPDHFAQNVVGCPTDAIDRFIGDPEAIDRCSDARARWLSEKGVYNLRNPVPERFLLGHTRIDWHFICERDPHGMMRPRVLPFEPRYAHFDLATTGQDYVGFAVGCYAGRRPSGDGRVGEPLTWIDFALRIERDGKEYDFAALRQLVDDFRSNGFNFAQISFDSWQSFDFGQQLQNLRKIKVERISLHDTVDGYVCMREALYGSRILFDSNKALQTELVQLERRIENNREKVGHRPGGHDDVADGLAAVVWEVTKSVDKMTGVAIKIHKPRVSQTGMPVEPMNAGAVEAYRHAVERETARILRQQERQERRKERKEARAARRGSGQH